MPESTDHKIGTSAEVKSTKRPTVPGIEFYLDQTIPVLDHGFIRVVDYMGDDDAIAEAARVSYGLGTKKRSENTGLINYLMRHRHTTPFEMCEIKLHVKLPIFVARQWIRHRTASVNEYSARYSILDREFYVPQANSIGEQSSDNKQGRAHALPADEAREAIDLLHQDALLSFEHYHVMLNQDESGKTLDQGRIGLSREIARIGLPLSTYTQWYWKIDLHNLFHFLLLRTDSHAQYELRVYAEKILEIVKVWVPIAYEAFLEHQVFGYQLSRGALSVVRGLLNGDKITQPDSGLSGREWKDLMRALGRD
jgi:thymidylate synthase (FAD)